MSAAQIADAERRDLADLFLRLGPDGPRCAGAGSTRDLRRPPGRPRAPARRRARHPDPAAGGLDAARAGPGGGQRDFGDLVGTLRTGPPFWSPLALPPLRAVDVQEYFIHHEDVRRAQSGWAPRPPTRPETACCGAWPACSAAEAYRSSPVAVTLPAPGRHRQRRPCVSGPRAVIPQRGEPGELLLATRRAARSASCPPRGRTPADVAAVNARPTRGLSQTPAERAAGRRLARLACYQAGAESPPALPRLRPRPTRAMTPLDRPAPPDAVARRRRPGDPDRHRSTARAQQARRPGRRARCARGSGVPTHRCPGPTGTPPPLAEGALRVVALGGIGEIGRNMTVLEYGGRLLIVDCGVLFPSEDSPGVDLILPDFRAIEDRLDDVDALVLTHGHEDHIGAVPFLLRQKPDLLVVGSRFTLALVAAKCREHRLTPHLLEVREGQRAPTARSTASSSRSTTRSPTRWPSPSARRRHRAAHRRHQARPAAPRRAADRPGRLLAPRRRGRRPAAGRLDERRGPGIRHAGARDRAR